MGRKRLAAAAALLAMALLGAGVALAGTSGKGKPSTGSSTSPSLSSGTTTSNSTPPPAPSSGGNTSHSKPPTPSSGSGSSSGSKTPSTKSPKPSTKHVSVFAPDTLRNASEVSGVILDASTHQFKQVVFDRGRVVAVTSTSITLRQQQDGTVWRTQTFDVPSNAAVTVEKQPVAGVASVPVSGALAVVRNNALRHEVPAMPTTGG
jgi:hypothetical protein